MGQGTAIEWTEATWNPVTGCTKISPGCKHCYAERLALRLQAMGQKNYANGFKLTLQPHSLELPLKWKKRQKIFVNSMSDLFHKSVPVEYIQRVFDAMHRANWHQYQILTKRSDRLLELDPLLQWEPHIWMGVSVEKCGLHVSHRPPTRDSRPHQVPLAGAASWPAPPPRPERHRLGIVGGESGPGARPMDPRWVIDIRDQCLRSEVPFFFKQWGGVFKKRTGRLLEGRTWDESPKSEPIPL